MAIGEVLDKDSNVEDGRDIDFSDEPTGIVQRGKMTRSSSYDQRGNLHRRPSPGIGLGILDKPTDPVRGEGNFSPLSANPPSPPSPLGSDDDGGCNISSSDDDLLHDDDDDDDDTQSSSSTIVRGYPPLPRPPESASRQQAGEHYWRLCYGAPPPAAPAAPLGAPQVRGGLGAGSWSASRLPPTRSCLSLKKEPRTAMAGWDGAVLSSMPATVGGGRRTTTGRDTAETPTLCDRLGLSGSDGENDVNNGNGRSRGVRGIAPSPMAAPFPYGEEESHGTPAVATVQLLVQPPLPRVVQFGSPSAAEFDKDVPPNCGLTPLPKEQARKRFPIEEKVKDVREMKEGVETRANSALLAAWDEDFDSFLDEEEGEDDSDEGSDGRRDSGLVLGSEDSDEDSDALVGRRGHLKKKRRRRPPPGGDGRRKSSFFARGTRGGSLLDGEDEDVVRKRGGRKSRDMEGGDVIVSGYEGGIGLEKDGDADSPQSPSIRPSSSSSPPSFASPLATTDTNPGSSSGEEETPDAERSSSAALMRGVHSSGGAILSAVSLMVSPTTSPPGVGTREDGSGDKKGRRDVEEDYDSDITRESLRPGRLDSMLKSCQGDDDPLGGKISIVAVDVGGDHHVMEEEIIDCRVDNDLDAVDHMHRYHDGYIMDLASVSSSVGSI